VESQLHLLLRHAAGVNARFLQALVSDRGISVRSDVHGYKLRTLSQIDTTPRSVESGRVNTKGFSEEQKAAITDLFVLGLYQDRHIASAEDERVKALLNSFDFQSDYSRQQFIDSSFGRVNKHPQTPEATRSAVFEYASKFKSESQRRQALDALAELLASDNQVTSEESSFLKMVAESLGLNKAP
jgi:hypothetical protein